MRSGIGTVSSDREGKLLLSLTLLCDSKCYVTHKYVNSFVMYCILRVKSILLSLFGIYIFGHAIIFINFNRWILWLF